MGNGIRPCPCPRLRKPFADVVLGGQKQSKDNGDPDSSSRSASEPVSHRAKKKGGKLASSVRANLAEWPGLQDKPKDFQLKVL